MQEEVENRTLTLVVSGTKFTGRLFKAAICKYLAHRKEKKLRKQRIRYAREQGIPYLGICLGMQMAIVEFARNVLGYPDANSSELDPGTGHPMIALMPDQEKVSDIGGTLRLGSYPCVLKKGTKAEALYGKQEISERHRHRYEVNNLYREKLEAHGMRIAGTSPDGRIVEMVELEEHPFFLGTQGHPEFKSRPNHAHPLFAGLIEAAARKRTEKEAGI